MFITIELAPRFRQLSISSPIAWMGFCKMRAILERKLVEIWVVTYVGSFTWIWKREWEWSSTFLFYIVNTVLQKLQTFVNNWFVCLIVIIYTTLLIYVILFRPPIRNNRLWLTTMSNPIFVFSSIGLRDQIKF